MAGEAYAQIWIFQCSLCRAVWWFSRCLAWQTLQLLEYSFSAPSVEPYGGSRARDMEEIRVIITDFQCSLCRAVWWFVA